MRPCRLCDSEYIHETIPGLFSDASTSVPRGHIRHELVRPSVHPKWPAFVVSVAEAEAKCIEKMVQDGNKYMCTKLMMKAPVSQWDVGGHDVSFYGEAKDWVPMSRSFLFPSFVC